MLLLLLAIFLILTVIYISMKPKPCKKSGQACRNDSVCCGKLTCNGGLCSIKHGNNQEDASSPYDLNSISCVNYRSLPASMPYWQLSAREEAGLPVPMDQNAMQCSRKDGNLVLYNPDC